MNKDPGGHDGKTAVTLPVQSGGQAVTLQIHNLSD